MPTTLSLHFPDAAGDGPISGSIVHRAHITASLGALFEVVMTVHSTDPAIDPHVLVGERAELWLDGEPHVDRIPGVIRAVRQLTSVLATTGAAASYYEVVLGPALFFARHRSGRRVHQNKDVVALVRDTCAAHGGAIDAPVANLSRTHAPREYTTQFDETDLDFIYRLLSEEHVTSYFDVSKGSGLVLVDDVATLTPSLPFRLAYVPPSNLDPSGPAALSLRFEDAYAPGAVGLRDYDFEHPQMSRGVPVALEGKADASDRQPFRREESLSAEHYEVGRFSDGAVGRAIAKRDLGALRGGAHTIECETNLAMFPGTRFFVDDHPRSSGLGELLVVGVRIQLDDGAPIPYGGIVTTIAGPSRRAYALRCVRVASGWAPPRRPKPRAIGPESAFVVGALSDGQIDVDEHGRVLVEFVWDRRDQRSGATSRRVRVSQGWAGANRGFVTLPRIGDEVLIGYDGGDADQPIVVGRVHNAVARTPLNLPDPDKTVSVWKSRTVGGDGFNQFLMDDQPGGERVEIRAEKTRTDLTLGNESSTVGGSYSQDVGGKETIHVAGDTEVDLDQNLDATIGGDANIHVKANLTEVVDGVTRRTAEQYIVSAGSILFVASGCSIEMQEGKITIKGAQIDIEASGSVNVKGHPINLN